ncbi:MAG: prolyl oligopeptidase family serine peptidase [Candidatus Delongbacteria bacterium]|nr:prolyl oligopeptidase family serine peptidase [Candidatus Delongbacteria bacterium]
MEIIKTKKVRAGYFEPFSMYIKDQRYPRVHGVFSFSKEFFNIKAIVEDIHFKDGDRSWRYGDGLIINFITEAYVDARPSNKFYAYGFSKISGVSQSVLVCHNGVFYLKNDDIPIKIDLDSENQKSYYDIKIPWKKIEPFNILMDQILGINIRYSSLNDDGSTTYLKLVEDDDFESESVDEKRYLPLELLLSDKSETQFSLMLENNLVSASETSVKIRVFSNKKQEMMLTTQIIGFPQGKLKKLINLNEGLQDFLIQFAVPNQSGSYILEVELGKEKHSQEFYRLIPEELSNLETFIRQLENKAETPLEKSSYYGLSYKLLDLKKNLEEFNPRDKISTIKEKIDEINLLYARQEKYGHLYIKGKIRTAFKSPDDGSLQIYSLLLPENFDPEKNYDLILCLHGSGVDEVGFLNSFLSYKEAFGENIIYAAPRGRDLSDYYIGQTEKDIIDLLKNIKEMFKISKTFILGFSMGGYGAWRLAFNHSELFNGAIINSGPIKAPFTDNTDIDIKSLNNEAKNIPYLVMHGTEDRAINFIAIKKFVDQLKKQEYAIEFKVFDGAGHGNFDPKNVIKEWIKNIK